MKIKPLVLAISMLVTGAVTASDGLSIYNLRVPTSDKLSSWSDTPHEYTEWSNLGAAYDCELWTPNVSGINLDLDFLQSRSCSLNQQRTRIEFEQDSFSDKKVETGRFLENQVIADNQTQTATGTKDYIVSSETELWSDWEDIGSPSCSSWSPATSTVVHGTSFTQERTCIQPQERSQDVYDVWKSGLKTLKETVKEAGSDSVNEDKNAVGTKIIRNMCIDILNRGESTGNKTYTVDPDGVGPLPAKSAYCLMSQGGWTLYDSFGTRVGDVGNSPSAYNARNINSASAISSAGYSHNLGSINSSTYYTNNTYMQFYLGGDPEGYIRKTMPSWVSSLRIDASGEHYGGSNRYSFGSSSYTTGAHSPRFERTFNGSGLLEMREGIVSGASGIIWVDAVWVK